MKLWMSGEIMREISKDFQAAESDVEEAVNMVLDVSNYGDGIVKWYHIPIIVDFDDSSYKEVSRYNKKTRHIEFRLRIPFDVFKCADSQTQRKLLMDSLRKSVSQMKTMNVPDFDFQKLEADMRELAAAKGWL